MSGIVVIGAGQAGAALSEKARSLGYTGTITLIGEEVIAPYQRPPLSKEYLLAEVSLERLFLRDLGFWEEQNITLKLGKPATAIHRSEKTVEVSGDTVPYEHLVLAMQLACHRRWLYKLQ